LKIILRMNTKSKFIWSILLGFIPVVWTLLLYFTGNLTNFEDSIIDKKFLLANSNHTFSDKIVIVDIDEESLVKFGNNEKYGRWPWKRNVYPEILGYIASGGPKSIIFDIMFPGESREDSEFAIANEQIPMISHAVSFRKDDLTKDEQSTDFMERHSYKQVKELEQSIEKYDRVTVPVGDIGFKAPHLHSVTYKSDPDNVARKYFFFTSYKNNIYPSLSIVALNSMEKVNAISHSMSSMVVETEKRKFTVPLDNGFYRLNFYPKEELYNAYSVKRIPISWIIDSLRDMENGRISNFDELKIQPEEYRSKIIIPQKYLDQIPIPKKFLSSRIIAEDIKDKAYFPAGLDGKIIIPEKFLRYIKFPKSIENDVFVPEDILTPDAFKDKIVLIGTSATATFDTKTIPFGNIPGVILHAIAISNIIQEDFLKMLPDWLTIATVLIMTTISSVLLVVSQNTFYRILVPFAFIIGYILLSFGLFKNDYSLNLSVFLISYPVSFTFFLAYQIFIEGAEKRKYSKILGNMVDPTIVSEALNDLEALKKGGEKEITAFFSDVAGFSTISEQLSSQDLAALLNEYLSAMTIILKEHRGTLDKYIGDAVVGIFGAPLVRPNHFLDAARASLKMIEGLEELKKYWTANNLYIPDAQKMNVRIGLNTGIAKVGFMGTDTLASYTMMGDTVNLAARLEAAGKDYGVTILISEMTKRRVENEMFTRELDAVIVKGKTEPVRIYELISEKGVAPQNLVESTGLYEEAFRLHLERKWDEAIKKFDLSMKAKGSKDKSAIMLIERCEDYKITPPPENWNGSYVRTHK
jgi:class 3 adenylate cyclase/CHASE2 domain-containing sensor protein